VQQNARFVLDVAGRYGSFGTFISRWPTEDLTGLFADMKKHGSRLGGMTGQRVLRNMGRDTFVITPDVTRCLQRAGLDIPASPASKRELALVQSAFNTWHAECALPYCHMSRICACSVE
jgi:3-methyladenine DNA glycosylase Tag